MNHVPGAQPPRAYWNHNTAYHPWILGVARERRRRVVLDVGCGEGLLLERLAPYADSLSGIDPDDFALARARARLEGVPEARLYKLPFDEFDSGGVRFDLITFVATIHHMRLERTLLRARNLLAPGGDLLIVGIPANRGPVESFVAGMQKPWARLGSAFHGEQADIGVVEAEPVHTLAQVRRAARTILPDAQIRRGLYYRYLLRWTAD